MQKILSIIAAVAILVSALMPNSYKVALHLNNGTHPVIHTLVHTAAFAVLAFLLGCTAGARRKYLSAVTAAIALGLLTEILEHTVYRQPLETFDIALDALGAILGASTARLTILPSLVASNLPNPTATKEKSQL